MNNNKSAIPEKEKLYLNSLTLAFLGDVVYEIMVRKQLIEENYNLPASKLHILAVEKVKASSQAKVYDYIEFDLTDKEREIMKRGRNSNSTHCPKHSSLIEYKKATGVEALFGFWYLNNEHEKIEQYFRKIYNFLEGVE